MTARCAFWNPKMAEGFPAPDQIRYMHAALKLARKAACIGEVPIGCVIVYDGPDKGNQTRYPDAPKPEHIWQGSRVT